MPGNVFANQAASLPTTAALIMKCSAVVKQRRLLQPHPTLCVPGSARSVVETLLGLKARTAVRAGLIASSRVIVAKILQTNAWTQMPDNYLCAVALRAVL